MISHWQRDNLRDSNLAGQGVTSTELRNEAHGDIQVKIVKTQW